MTATITTQVLSGFEDPTFSPAEWSRLLSSSQTNVLFLTREWQAAWWETFRRGELLLAVARRDGEVVAFAPFFTEAGMIYFVGSGGSDYLDFIGDIGEPGILDALLVEARRHVGDFIGFLFYHVPDQSATGRLLEEAASRLGLKIFEEGALPAPVLDLHDANLARAAANKKSLLRHEKFFTRDGPLKVSHLTGAEEILPQLDEFFAQHRERWAGTPHPSLFCDEAQCRFYRALVSSNAAWLRFTCVAWQGRPIAFHFGFSHDGCFMWYKPSFAIDLARHSPGEVLLRQLLLAAMAEGAHTFDFGLGEEAFKSRFATRVNRVRNWGLYDPRALTHHAPRPTST